MTGSDEPVLHFPAGGLGAKPATCDLRGVWGAGLDARRYIPRRRTGRTVWARRIPCCVITWSAPSGSDADMQEALGLKVSQFVGLMGDAPLPPEQQQDLAAQARRHVERLAAAM